MTKRTVYRYDNEAYAIGVTVVSRGDHVETLDPNNVAAEQALRAVSPFAAETRRCSLYVWATKEFAVLAHALSRAKYLYECEIDEADIVHIGNVDHFTSARDAINAETRAAAANRYWDAPASGKDRRDELLVKKAIVVSQLMP